MAKRRMLSENIIESDEFASLSFSAQALYLHFNMNADDDGFVGNPTRIIRSIKGNKKSLSELIESEYLIAFPSGVIVITHWLSHNRIKRDRYTPTRFLEEFSSLTVKDNAIYIKGKEDFCGDKTEQNVSNSAPQVSIGKVSIVKDSIDKLSEDKDSLRERIEKKREVEKSLYGSQATEASLDEPPKLPKAAYSSTEELNNKEATLKEKKKESSKEDSVENDRSFSVSRCLREDFNINSFIRDVQRYFVSKYKSLDDFGFIDYYRERNFCNEEGVSIIDEYRYYVDLWMDSI